MKKSVQLRVLERLLTLCEEAGYTGEFVSRGRIVTMLENLSGDEVRDILGFISFCSPPGKEQKEPRYILVNVFHDLNGLFSKPPGFSPRTKGYHKYLPKHHRN